MNHIKNTKFATLPPKWSLIHCCLNVCTIFNLNIFSSGLNNRHGLLQFTLSSKAKNERGKQNTLTHMKTELTHSARGGVVSQKISPSNLSFSQVRAGLACGYSKAAPPVRRRSHSSLFTGLLLCCKPSQRRIIKSNLCFSKGDQHAIT